MYRRSRVTPVEERTLTSGVLVKKQGEVIGDEPGNTRVDLDPDAYGYRPKRSAQDAIRKVHKLLCEGYTDGVDADLSKYFDTIPHCALLQCVARRVIDREVLRLIKMWLKARSKSGTRMGTGA